MTRKYFEDAEIFANILKGTNLPNNEIRFGNFSLPVTFGATNRIKYNHEDFEMLSGTQQYTCKIYGGELQVSLQLYLEMHGYYTLECVTKFNSNAQTTGIAFSVNLTNNKESDNAIFLTQKIKFSEQCSPDKKLAADIRRQKQILLCKILRKIGIDVTDNNDVILGIFDPTTEEFLNTTPELFLNNFFAISLLKGHFQGNKGYEIELIPTYQFRSFNNSSETSIDNAVLSKKMIFSKIKREIPLALRYKILKRDNSTCQRCGRSVERDGITLHIDHKTPYSLGGLTEISNLWALCSDCNLGKSNNFVDL